MTTRIITKPLVVAGSADQTADQNLDFVQAELEDIVGDEFRVVAAYIDKGDDSGNDVSIKTLVVANQKNTEKQYTILPLITGTVFAKVDTLNALIKPEARVISDPHVRRTKHGLRLVYRAKNANAAARNLVVAVVVDNPGAPGTVGYPGYGQEYPMPGAGHALMQRPGYQGPDKVILPV